VRTIVTIVEGDGEVFAVPTLLRRLAAEHRVFDAQFPPPIRVHRDRFLRKNEEFRRILLLASAKAAGGTVLVLLDADDDCPVLLAQRIIDQGEQFVRDCRLAVVIAQKEYEAWLLAAAASLAGKRGLAADVAPPPNPDAVRNAKGWLSERMGNARYHEVTDQAALTAVFDIHAAEATRRSFRKLRKEVAAALLTE
jgi:hypothetical protein